MRRCCARIRLRRLTSLLGGGYLAFTVDQGPDQNRHQGIVTIEGGNLAEMALHYFRTSEQLRCFVHLACEETADGWRAGALVLEKIAGAGGIDPRLDDDAQEESWRTATILAATLTDAELLDDALSPERLLYRLFHTEGVATDRARALSYGCRCSRARLVGILEGFPPDDLDHMAVDGDIVMTCEFCNYDFRFPRAGRARPQRLRHADRRRRHCCCRGWWPAAAAASRRDFPPLHYNYLTPLRLNVATMQIEQRFVPSGAPPDVSQFDPMPPVQALRNMAADRLQALGAAGSGRVRHPGRVADTARRHDQRQLRGGTRHLQHADHSRRLRPGQRVIARYTGDLDDLLGRLYDMTKTMMDRMNVEFEYQVRRSLGSWLLAAGAVQAPVEQQPLTQTPPGTEPQPDMPPQTMPPPPTPMPSPTP